MILSEYYIYENLNVISIISKKIENNEIEIFKHSINLFAWDIKYGQFSEFFEKFKKNNKFSLMIRLEPYKKDRSNVAGEYNSLLSMVTIYNCPAQFSNSFKTTIYKILHTIYHEVGHNYYRKFLTNKCKNLLKTYINTYTKEINLENIKKTKEKYHDDFNTKFPLSAFLLDGAKLEQKSLNKKNKMFTRPVSHYNLNEEEIFCELFAQFMTKNYVPASNKLKYFSKNHELIYILLSNSCT